VFNFDLIVISVGLKQPTMNWILTETLIAAETGKYTIDFSLKIDLKANFVL
jgi:hypothetical protein